MSQKKIGFLFIDKSYSVYHALSIAIALSQTTNYEIEILVSPRNKKVVQSLLKTSSAQHIRIKQLRPYWYFTIPHYLEIKLQFRKLLFIKYKRHLEQFDGLVCTLYNDLLLKKILQHKQPKLIFAGHGIANRAYSFDDKICSFDLIFMAGSVEKEKRASLGQLTKSNFVLTGYFKTEFKPKMDKTSIFKNSKPVILYNPHWEPKLGSFQDMGMDILEFFAGQDEYNLIFAPHSLLATRNFDLRFKLRKFTQYENIKIDLGSEASNDLSYLSMADLFLGDVSSQALEFILLKPRPCLFLDAHGLISSQQYYSWELGKVLNNTNNLRHELESAFATFDSKYLELQVSRIDQLFYNGNQAPSEIAATAIRNLLISSDRKNSSH